MRCGRRLRKRQPDAAQSSVCSTERFSTLQTKRCLASTARYVSCICEDLCKSLSNCQLKFLILTGVLTSMPSTELLQLFHDVSSMPQADPRGPGDYMHSADLPSPLSGGRPLPRGPADLGAQISIA